VNPLQTAIATDGIINGIETITGNGINAANASIVKHFNEKVSYNHKGGLFLLKLQLY
jgi:hypothetical protein